MSKQEGGVEGGTGFQSYVQCGNIINFSIVGEQACSIVL